MTTRGCIVVWTSALMPPPTEIRRAYRRLAQASHPDTHPGDADAPRRFLAITEAYEILSDPQRRARYDHDQLKPPGQQPSPAARPGPPRPAATPLTFVFVEPATLNRPIIIGSPSNPPDRPPLVVGPLHWQPEPGPYPATARPAVDMQELLHALRPFGWW